MVLRFLHITGDTNDTENYHKQIVSAYATWTTGVEMSDCMLDVHRHRFNHDCAERKRLNFPRIGHYDTWLIDALQLLVQANHGVLLYPHWSNSSDFIDTPEKFGTVRLHSDQLGQALKNIELDSSIKFSGEKLYLCNRMDTPAPFLPVDGEDEIKLFNHLMLTLAKFDAHQMAVEWCKYVDGKKIFPKLPIYLMPYHKIWEQKN